MPNLSPSLFIKEPGKTKNLNITSPQLKKEVKALKVGDLLDVRIVDDKVFLYSKSGNDLIAQVNDAKTAKKIIFTLKNHGQVLAIFVGTSKGLKATDPTAQFLIKSSMPIFNNESLNADLKPFVRSGVAPTEEEEPETETGTGTEDLTDDRTRKSETDPLAGLRIIAKEDLPNQPEE